MKSPVAPCARVPKPPLNPPTPRFLTPCRKYYNASWTPLLGTPQHPEYPSAHQGIFGGGWSVLVRELGGKTDYTFTVKSDCESHAGASI